MRLGFVTSRGLQQLSDDDRLVVADLRHHGVMVESAVWDSPLVDWSVYDALILRSPWDYHERPEEFTSWLALVERLGVPTWNPPSLVRWNMDKQYLCDLEERGVPIVPTTVVERGSGVRLTEVIAATGWSEVVFKPAIGASGFHTTRVRASDAALHAQTFDELVSRRDVLVQPFVREILREGEWSMVFIGGSFSHAVRNRSREGDYRVQSDFGGSTVAEAPRGVLVAQAEDVIRNIPGEWLYARVDACEVDGQLLLMELELVEPSLFLGFHPSAPRRFSAAIRQRVAGRRTPLSFTPRSSTPST